MLMENVVLWYYALERVYLSSLVKFFSKKLVLLHLHLVYIER